MGMGEQNYHNPDMEVFSVPGLLANFGTTDLCPTNRLLTSQSPHFFSAEHLHITFSLQLDLFGSFAVPISPSRFHGERREQKRKFTASMF